MELIGLLSVSNGCRFHAFSHADSGHFCFIQDRILHFISGAVRLTWATSASGDRDLGCRLLTLLRVLGTFRLYKIHHGLAFSCVRIIRRQLRMEDRFFLYISQGRASVLVQGYRCQAYRWCLFMVNRFARDNDRYRWDLTHSHLSHRYRRFRVQIVRGFGDGALFNIPKLSSVVLTFRRPTSEVDGEVVAYRCAVAVALRRGAFVQVGRVLGIGLTRIRSLFEEVSAISRYQVCVFGCFVKFFGSVRVRSLVYSVVLAGGSSEANLRARVRVLNRRGELRFQVFHHRVFDYHRGRVVQFPSERELPCFDDQRVTNRGGRASRSFSRFRPFKRGFITYRRVRFACGLADVRVGLLISLLGLVRFFRCSGERVSVVFLGILRTVMIIGGGVYIRRGVFLDSRNFFGFGY